MRCWGSTPNSSVRICLACLYSDFAAALAFGEHLCLGRAYSAAYFWSWPGRRPTRHAVQPAVHCVMAGCQARGWLLVWSFFIEQAFSRRSGCSLSWRLGVEQTLGGCSSTVSGVHTCLWWCFRRLQRRRLEACVAVRRDSFAKGDRVSTRSGIPFNRRWLVRTPIAWLLWSVHLPYFVLEFGSAASAAARAVYLLYKSF